MADERPLDEQLTARQDGAITATGRRFCTGADLSGSGPPEARH